MVQPLTEVRSSLDSAVGGAAGAADEPRPASHDDSSAVPATSTPATKTWWRQRRTGCGCRAANGCVLAHARGRTTAHAPAAKAGLAASGSRSNRDRERGLGRCMGVPAVAGRAVRLRRRGGVGSGIPWIAHQGLLLRGEYGLHLHRKLDLLPIFSADRMAVGNRDATAAEG